MMTGQHDANAPGLSSIKMSFKHGFQFLSLLFRMNKKYLSIIAILYAIQGFMPIAVLLATKNLLNSIAISWEKGFQWAIIQLAIFIFVYVVKNIITSIQTYVESLFQNLLTNEINGMICEKSTQLGLADFENSQIQDQLNRAQQEANYRPYQMFSQMMSICSGVITMVASAVMLIFWEWWVVFALLFVSCASFYFVLKLNREQFQMYLERTPQYRESWYITYILSNNQAFKEVKMFQLGSYLLHRYRSIIQVFFEKDKQLMKKRLRVTFIFDMLELAVLFGIISLALRDAYLQVLLIGSLFAYIQAITLVQSQSQSVVQLILQFSQNNLYIEQLLLFLRIRSSDPSFRQMESHTRPVSSANCDFRIEQISFENVSFSYPDKDKRVIDQISLTLQRGKTTAIVGRNGSGKSTLIKLLMQLYGDYEGTIKINERNIQSFNLNEVQQKIGIVFQDFVQYEMPVRQNIGFGSIDDLNNDKKIYEASSYAGIQDLIQSLPQSLDTQLGKWMEGGYQLSGGQWQRIAIARAFMRNADVYLFDEPSSFLDPMAERDLFALFRQLMKDRIGVFITHRYASARFADQIIVMEEGRMIEAGTHRELMVRNGVYAEMYNLQANSFLDEEESEPMVHKGVGT
ncbi:ABC transporter ATP-binding protein [Paenibacillus sp. SI8]|uniref:ABC transporter ATP-binding protein n=1 Tax=unclassified Paenibacillus TaxID=185978 RepID=UPI00346617C0